ncbi:MAG: NYN domain-containing protein [Bacteroidales bacterium]|nr:NYN domain-containing protein [Bacteroidales bacterium]
MQHNYAHGEAFPKAVVSRLSLIMGLPTLELLFFIMIKDQSYPPIKIAILIDGGFFLKRFNALYNKERNLTGPQVADMLYTMAMKHVGNKNTLYRIFYYDCFPLDKKAHNPISKKPIDFSKSDEYKFKMELLEALKKKRKVALRMGTLKDNHNWKINQSKLKDLLAGKITLEDLTEKDVMLDVRQKGIDMKIGVDIASLALKKFVDQIVLFSGDSDFVPASKLARREGIDFVLDSMKANVEPQLFEHIDGIHNVTPYIDKTSKVKHTKTKNEHE